MGPRATMPFASISEKRSVVRSGPCPARTGPEPLHTPPAGLYRAGFRGRRGEAAAGFTIIERWNGCGPRMGRFAVLVPDRRRAW